MSGGAKLRAFPLDSDHNVPMRPLEIVLILATLGCLFIPYLKMATFGRIAAIGLAAIMLAQLIQEAGRWQMLPVYSVAAIWIALAIAGIGLPLWIGRIGIAGGVLMLVAGFGLGTLLPVLQAPPTTGNFAVGTATYHLVQNDRPEIFSDDPNDLRQLMLQVWYPAVESDAPVSPYIPDISVGGPAIAGVFGLPSFILNHVNLVQPNARVMPPLAGSAESAEAETTFPLLLFSHGRSGTRIQNTQQVEELVSHGYIVAAVDHAYGAGYTVYPDGRSIPYDQGIFGDDSPEQAGLVVDEWVKDFQYAIDSLFVFNNSPDHLLSNSINFSQIGAFGHSTGGGAAYEFCFRDERCGAALGLDPWLVPTSDEVVETGMNKPIMSMKQDQPLGELSDARLKTMFENTGAPSYYIEVAGTRHYDFTDFKRLSPALGWVGLTGSIEGTQIRDITNAYTRAFFDFHLRGWQGAILFADSAEFPEVTFTKR